VLNFVSKSEEVQEEDERRLQDQSDVFHMCNHSDQIIISVTFIMLAIISVITQSH
jgi:hypothetical protein